MADSGEHEPAPVYPKQDLLPQQVASGSNRKPLIIGIAVVLVLALGGVGAYVLMRDNEDADRAAYCDQLRELTKGGDLSAAMQAFGPELTDELQRLIDAAPDTVADDWQKLHTLFASTNGGEDVDMSRALEAYEAVQTIARDANDECDLPIEIPTVPGV
jgi:hypothetical protein